MFYSYIITCYLFNSFTCYTEECAKKSNFTAGKHADLTSQKDFRVVAEKASNFFGIEDEIKLVGNKGKVNIQAQNNTMEIYTDKNLKILSDKDRIEISAQKEILLTSGKAYINIIISKLYPLSGTRLCCFNVLS